MYQQKIARAAQLAKWLIEVKNKPSNIAYIIACNKYGLPPLTGRAMVRKEYQKIKGKNPNQTTLFDGITKL